MCTATSKERVYCLEPNLMFINNTQNTQVVLVNVRRVINKENAFAVELFIIFIFAFRIAKHMTLFRIIIDFPFFLNVFFFLQTIQNNISINIHQKERYFFSYSSYPIVLVCPYYRLQLVAV